MIRAELENGPRARIWLQELFCDLVSNQMALFTELIVFDALFFSKICGQIKVLRALRWFSVLRFWEIFEGDLWMCRFLALFPRAALEGSPLVCVEILMKTDFGSPSSPLRSPGAAYFTWFTLHCRDPSRALWAVFSRMVHSLD